jgi:phage tail-like protein
MMFPALTISNPLPGFNFAVSFSESDLPASAIAGSGVSQVVAGFQEVSGLESSIQIQEYKEGGINDYTHKFASTVNFGNITFKRGAAVTPDLWSWYSRVRRGSYGARRTIVIAHLDYEGQAALVWTVRRALPSKYTGPAWNSGQSSVGIESLEIAHEGLELVPATDFGAGGVAPRS